MPVTFRLHDFESGLGTQVLEIHPPGGGGIVNGPSGDSAVELEAYLYEWDVAATLSNQLYAYRVKQSGVVRWTGYFRYEGAAVVYLGREALAEDVNVTASLSVSPIVGSTPDRAGSTTIPLFVGETIPTTITLFDGAGGPVDLSGFSSLELVIEDDTRADVQVISTENLTISGADNNQLTFTNNGAVTQSPRNLAWSLRDTDNGEVLQRGTVNITYAPEADE